MAESTTPVVPAELPVVPLREAVAFPLSVLPLTINRAVSIDAVNRALAAGDRMLFLALQSTNADDPQPSDLRTVGTVGVIRQMARTPAGIQVVIEDADAVLADLRAKGVDAQGVDEQQWGRFVSVADPDGNRWTLQQLPKYV